MFKLYKVSVFQVWASIDMTIYFPFLATVRLQNKTIYQLVFF